MLRWMARLYLRITGWTLLGSPPDLKKYVVVAAPHTSNWDAVYMLAMATIYGIRIHWAGKHTLFQFPLGWFMRWIGGLPVNRRSGRNTVQQLADEFAKRDRLILAVAPEGTRERAEFWKSGFYFIACQAKVPLVLGVLNYEKKTGGLYHVIEPTGDIHVDMEKIRNFYTESIGKFPEKFGPVRLREEFADSKE